LKRPPPPTASRDVRVEAGRKPRTGLKHGEHTILINSKIVEAGRKPRTGLKHFGVGFEIILNELRRGREKTQNGIETLLTNEYIAPVCAVSRQGENPERD